MCYERPSRVERDFNQRGKSMFLNQIRRLSALLLLLGIFLIGTYVMVLIDPALQQTADWLVRQEVHALEELAEWILRAP